MKFNKMKQLMIYILLFLSIFTFDMINTQIIQAQENQVIRVGYTNHKGSIEKKDGLYTGYLYDYLREISIYTGWEYEFIEMDVSEGLQALKDGDIDLMGAMIKNEQSMKIFDFSNYEIGYTYTTLVVPKDSNLSLSSSYILLDDMNVGYWQTAKTSLQNFMNFCEDNGIKDITLTPVAKGDNDNLLMEKLEMKEVDAIITGDLTIDDEAGQVIARFGATPYYFATTKGNTELIKELDKTIAKIRDKDSDFKDKLYNKYFQKANGDYLILSQEEIDYIKEMAPLKVAYVTNLLPLQFYNEKTNTPDGVLVDYINELSQKTSIPIELVPISGVKEGYELLKNNQIDIVLGLEDNYKIADEYNFLLTKNIFNVDMQLVVNKNIALEREPDHKVIALVDGGIHTKDTSDYTVQYYQTLEECIEAVNKGEASMAYMNRYAMSHYLASGLYKNVTMMSTYYQIPLVLGVSKHLDKNLIAIINKVVYLSNEEDMISMINEKMLEIQEKITLKEFIHYHFLTLLNIAAIFILLCVLIYMKVKRRFNEVTKHRQILFEKTQIDSLTGVYNREGCERLIKEYLQTKDLSLYAILIIIDIDYFKQINDRFGHKVGDNLLKEFSSILKRFFSHKDIISRLGGDEFIILMKDVQEKDISCVGEKLKALCQAMNRSVECNGQTQKISLSMGAVIIREYREFDELYVMADEMLYDVKRNGKNGFKIYPLLENMLHKCTC